MILKTKARSTKIFVLVLFGILIAQNTYSQVNFIPGKIINLKGDTLSGFIDYRNWRKNPNKIEFKQTPESEPITYNPTNIKAFIVKDEVYESGIVDSNIDLLKDGRLIEDITELSKVDTTFLQALKIGNKSLYFYRNKDGIESFYMKKGSSNFELLTYTRYYKIQEGIHGIFENNKYIGQLAFYLNDCSAIQSYLKSVTYNQKGMEKVYNKYYECVSSEVDFQRKIEKASLEVGVIAGPTISSLTFKSSHFEHIVDATSNYSPNLSYGFFYDVIMPRDHRKWSIYNELFFTSYKTSHDYRKHASATSTFEYSYLKTNHFFRYKYPIGKHFMFFNAGFSVGLAIKDKNYKDYKLGFSTINRTEMHPVLEQTRRFEQSLIFGVGVKTKRFSYEIRHESGNGMSNYSSLQSITKRYYFLCGYRF